MPASKETNAESYTTQRDTIPHSPRLHYGRLYAHNPGAASSAWSVSPCGSSRSLVGLSAANVLPIIQSLRATGVRDLRGLATALNNRGVRTAHGGRWHVSNVKNLVDRLPE